jgi:hypothetical protein
MRPTEPLNGLNNLLPVSGFLKQRNAAPTGERGTVPGVEEEGDVAFPKTFADRAAVMITKINIQNGCRDPRAIQK